MQTVDFFTPIVDDPYLFGAIAAANALSDVYAMGVTPLTALNILCFPIHERPAEELAAILRGGAEKLAEASVTLLGGHSVEDPEPKYGLCVTGLVDPEKVTTNAGAQAGDVIVLTKPLGTGVITTAAKFGECDQATLAAACASMTRLNAGAAEAMRAVGIGERGVHAATDITGFGLIGHLRQLAIASGVSLEIDAAALPALPRVEELAMAGNITRGERENADFAGDALTLDEGVPAGRRSLLFDPQTSGGLAIFVHPDSLPGLLSALRESGTLCQAVIGRAVLGEAGQIHVTWSSEREV